MSDTQETKAAPAQPDSQDHSAPVAAVLADNAGPSASLTDEESAALKVDGMFAVEPRSDCPHVLSCLAAVLNFELSDPCTECHSTAENWVCITCSRVACSRYVEGHMAEHVAKTQQRSHRSAHCIAFSFSDFSFWCFACESYIKCPLFKPILDACQQARFGAQGGPVGAIARSHASTSDDAASAE